MLFTSLSIVALCANMNAGPKSIYGTVFIDGAIADVGVGVKIVIDGNTFNTTTIEWDEDNYIIGIPPGYEGETGYFYVGDDWVPYDNQSITIGSETGYSVDLHANITVPNNYPNEPTNPLPYNGATEISLNPTLSVRVTDPNGDSMDVSFYDFSDGSLISIDTNVASGGIASVTWLNLGYYTEYEWYAIAEDSTYSNQSDIWSFITEEEVNDPPVLSGESPSDGAIIVPMSISSLSIHIDDPEDDSFNWNIETSPDVGSNDSNGDTDGTKTCFISGLNYSMTYTWYVNATDPSGSGTYAREVYTFTTEPSSNDSPAVVSIEDVNVSLGDVSAGFINVTGVSNLGSFSINLSWDPSVVNVTNIDDSDFTIFNYTNYEIGSVNITGYSMSGVSGDFTIARLEFEAVGSAGDSCDLEIAYSQLLTAYPIPSEINHTRINGTAYIFGNDPPYKPILVSPSDGATGVGLTPTLSVDILDPDGDSMNVSFYNASDDSIIDTVNDGINGSTVSVIWAGLSHNTTYEWYAVANDSEFKTLSDTWNFTTILSTANHPPDEPTNPSPIDEAANVNLSPILSVDVTDPDGDNMDVRFCNSDDVIIGIDTNVSSGATASFQWSNLAYDTTYEWYAVSKDSQLETKSAVWNFTTATNAPPNIPSNPFPANDAINVGVNDYMSWDGGDPYGDPVTYDVYFGMVSSPPKVKSNQSTESYNPGTMNHNITYYWRIVAWDNYDISSNGSIWSFTTTEVPANHPPNEPVNPSPESGAIDVDTAADISWISDDPDGDPITYDVYFGTVSPPPKVEANQSGTSYNPGIMNCSEMYYWQIVVWDDKDESNESPIWNFTTADTPTNHPPSKPVGPSPSDDATGVSLSPTLHAIASDPDGDMMDVSFFDASDDSLIGTDTNVASGGLASVIWPGLTKGSTYEWYAIADDSEFENTSDIWSFTTHDVELDIDITSGIGVTAIIRNIGNDDAYEVGWSISIESKGLLGKIDESSEGVINILEAGGEIVAKKLLIFGLSKVEITVTAECAGTMATTAATDALLIGIWLILI